MLVQKIFTASLAYPLKFEIKNAFNYAMGDLKGRGTIDTLQNSYRSKLLLQCISITILLFYHFFYYSNVN